MAQASVRVDARSRGADLRTVARELRRMDDRKVKERFRELNREGRAITLTKKPLEPSDAERAENPAARSAKLRALEWMAD